MRRLIVAAVGALGSLAAAGENLLQCVAPVVQEGLLFRGAGAIPEISDEMPAAIAALAKPANLDWIAGMGDTGAFRSTDENVAVLDAVLDELDRDGWDGSIVMQPSSNRRAVIVACRGDDEVQVRVWPYASVTYLTYNRYTVGETSVCRPIRARPGSLALDSVLPRLDFKAIDRSARTGRRDGAFGGAASAYSYTQVTIESDLASLADGLSDQLLAQGWQPDTSWSGRVMAGSTWSLEEDGKQYVGALDVIDLGSSSFNVAISIEERRQ